MRKIVYALSLALLCAGAVVVLSAQGPPQLPKGWIHIPDSTMERLEDIGVFAHTNHLIHVGPKYTGAAPAGQTPASIWKIYVGSGSPAGGSRTIAIVDAYHYATALNDFNVFSRQFGLPVATSS